VLWLYLRKKEEAKAGFRDNPLHHGGIVVLEPLIHRGDEARKDVNEWITNEEKKRVFGDSGGPKGQSRERNQRRGTRICCSPLRVPLLCWAS
jgi:hypothetical protein